MSEHGNRKSPKREQLKDTEIAGSAPGLQSATCQRIFFQSSVEAPRSSPRGDSIDQNQSIGRRSYEAVGEERTSQEGMLQMPAACNLLTYQTGRMQAIPTHQQRSSKRQFSPINSPEIAPGPPPGMHSAMMADPSQYVQYLQYQQHQERLFAAAAAAAAAGQHQVGIIPPPPPHFQPGSYAGQSGGLASMHRPHPLTPLESYSQTLINLSQQSQQLPRGGVFPRIPPPTGNLQKFQRHPHGSPVSLSNRPGTSIAPSVSSQQSHPHHHPHQHHQYALELPSAPAFFEKSEKMGAPTMLQQNRSPKFGPDPAHTPTRSTPSSGTPASSLNQHGRHSREADPYISKKRATPEFFHPALDTPKQGHNSRSSTSLDVSPNVHPQRSPHPLAHHNKLTSNSPDSSSSGQLIFPNKTNFPVRENPLELPQPRSGPGSPFPRHQPSFLPSCSPISAQQSNSDDEEDDREKDHHPQQSYPHSQVSHFAKGSMIQLANGRLKRVEELDTDDFVNSAGLSGDLVIDTSKVIHIRQNHESGTAILGFAVGKEHIQVSVEASLEHPFFVFGRGWSSCSPAKTLHRYGLACHPLSIGDVCISLTQKDHESSMPSDAGERSRVKPEVSTITRASPSSEWNDRNGGSCSQKDDRDKQDSCVTITGSKFQPCFSKEPATDAQMRDAVNRKQNCTESSASLSPGISKTTRKRRWSAPDSADGAVNNNNTTTNNNNNNNKTLIETSSSVNS